MERYFNTEGLCDPDLHYMVRLDERLKEIKQLFVDRGKYFIINRGRQRGVPLWTERPQSVYQKCQA